MGFWEDLKSFLNYSFLDVSLDKIALALGVLLVVYALRQVFTRIGMTLLRKISGKTKSNLDDQLLDVIEAPARLAFVVIGLWVAFEIMQLPSPAALLAGRIVRSLFAIVVIWTAYRGTKIISTFLNKLTSKTETQLDDQIVVFINKALRVLVIAVGAMIIVREWGYDVAGLIAGLGLGGLAFALAAKDTVANLFGSLTIMVDRPFVVGDWIETPAVEGTVEDIRLRSTVVRTFANALVTVPNSKLSDSAITNWSRMEKRRIKFNLGVTYGSSAEQVEQCVKNIKDMLENHPEIHKDVIFIYFTDFGDSALEIFLYFFTTTTNWQKYLEVRQDVNIRIMKIVEDLGMSVAFPSRSIYLENVEPHTQEQWENIVNKAKT